MAAINYIIATLFHLYLRCFLPLGSMNFMKLRIVTEYYVFLLLEVIVYYSNFFLGETMFSYLRWLLEYDHLKHGLIMIGPHPLSVRVDSTCFKIASRFIFTILVVSSCQPVAPVFVNVSLIC